MTPDRQIHKKNYEGNKQEALKNNQGESALLDR